MSNERELIDLAAKAAGISGHWVEDHGSGDYYYNGQSIGLYIAGDHMTASSVWNPLTDDGNALRLAVKLHIVPDFHATSETIPAHIYANLPKKRRGWAVGRATWVSAEYVPGEMWETGRAEDQKFADWYLQEYPVVVRGVGPATRRAIVLAAAEIGKAMA